jgi:hypothetical protein
MAEKMHSKDKDRNNLLWAFFLGAIALATAGIIAEN